MLVHTLTCISPPRENSSSSDRGVGQRRIKSADIPRWRSARITSSSLTLPSRTAPPSHTSTDPAMLLFTTSCCTRLITSCLSVCSGRDACYYYYCMSVHISLHMPSPRQVDQTLLPLLPPHRHPLCIQRGSRWCPAHDVHWPHHS